MQGMNGLEKFRSGPWFRFSCQWRQFPSIILFLGQIKSQRITSKSPRAPKSPSEKTRNGFGIKVQYSICYDQVDHPQPPRVPVWAHLKIECSVPHLTVTILTHYARGTACSVYITRAQLTRLVPSLSPEMHQRSQPLRCKIGHTVPRKELLSG